MPILHSAKIIFVHIPKTGGGTIEKTLGIYGKNNNGNLNPDHSLLYGKYKKKFLQHLTISEIKKINIKENDLDLNYHYCLYHIYLKFFQ